MNACWTGSVAIQAARWYCRSTDAPDLTEIGSVGRCAADWVASLTADDQVQIGPIGSERVVARRAELLASLPPSVLTAHDAGIEACIEAGTGAHTSLRRLDRHPVAGGNAAHLGRLRVQLHLR